MPKGAKAQKITWRNQGKRQGNILHRHKKSFPSPINSLPSIWKLSQNWHLISRLRNYASFQVITFSSNKFNSNRIKHSKRSLNITKIQQEADFHIWLQIQSTALSQPAWRHGTHSKKGIAQKVPTCPQEEQTENICNIYCSPIMCYLSLFQCM